MNKLLIYTCCDEKYSHFVPLFVASNLWSNKNIDIEIHLESSLTDSEKSAIEYIKSVYPKSEILIKENCYEKISTNIYRFNNQKVWSNTLRFIDKPDLYAEYVYISDVDIVVLEDIFDVHYQHMVDRGLVYSNIVRKNAPTHLTGLHFVKYDEYFPVDEKFKVSGCDEEVLLKIMKAKNHKIDYDTDFRPVHGIHMSLNRPDVADGKVVGWGAEPYENQWNEFYNSDLYKNISFSFDEIIINQINKLLCFFQQ